MKNSFSQNRTIWLQLSVACLLVLLLTSCSSPFKRHKTPAPEITLYLNGQIGMMSLDEALLQWGSPIFFTQQGNKRVAVWRSSNEKLTAGAIIGEADPTNMYNRISTKLGAQPDTGWELRASFDERDVLTDWRYREW